MPLHIHLHEEKIRRWPSLVDEAVATRSIRRKSLGELIGKLAFAQTSIFGRFGRTLLKPLVVRLYSNPYAEFLTETDVRVLEWLAASIRATIPRIVEFKSPHPEILIYTAAAGKLGTSSSILAAVVSEPGLLSSDGFPSAALTERKDPIWETISRQPHTFTAMNFWLFCNGLLPKGFHQRKERYFLRGKLQH